MNTHNVKAAEKTSLATSSMMIRQNKMKTISSITSNPCTPLQKTEDGPSTDSYSAKLAVVYCICTRTFHWYSPQREKCTKQATSFGPVYCLQPPLLCRVCRSGSYTSENHTFFISTSCVCSFVACSNSTSGFCDSYQSHNKKYQYETMLKFNYDLINFRLIFKHNHAKHTCWQMNEF